MTIARSKPVMKTTIQRSLLLFSAVVAFSFLLTMTAVAQTAKPTPQPTPRRPIPKLSTGARGFDNKNKNSTSRLIAIGGGYGADEDLEPLPKLKRKTALGYYQWGDALYNRSKMDQAVVAFEQAVKLNPNFVNAYWRLGNAYSEYNNLIGSDESKFDDQECYRRAIAAFEQVKRLQPQRAGVYNNLGVLYFNTSQFAKTVDAFQTGLRLKVKGKQNDVSLMEGGTLDDVNLYVYLADAYERMDKNDLALEFYQRARREGIGHLAGSIDARMGLVYEKLDDIDKAIAAYEAIDLTNGFYDYEATDRTAEILEHLGLLYASKRDYEHASALLDKAIQSYLDRLKNQKDTVPAEDETQDVKAAWLEEAHANQSALSSAWYNLGVVYLSMKKTEEAVTAFQNAIGADAKNVEARFNLGYAYLALGNKDAARQQAGALKEFDKEIAEELEKLILN